VTANQPADAAQAFDLLAIRREEVAEPCRWNLRQRPGTLHRNPSSHPVQRPGILLHPLEVSTHDRPVLPGLFVAFRRIDHLVLVADPSPRGISAARAIRELADQLVLPVGKAWLLLNRPYAAGDGGCVPSLPVPLLAAVPHDPALPAWEASGRSFLDLPDSSPAASAIYGAIRNLLPGNGR